MYELGDLVRIKDQFWTCRTASSIGYNYIMKNMQGQEYTIKYKNINGNKYQYRLATDDVHNWIWDENWLEPVDVLNNLKDVYTEELDLLFMGD